MSPPGLDLEALRQLQASVGADDETMRGIVGRYLAEADKLMAEWRDAVGRADAVMARHATHTLKSMAGTFGATALSHLCRDAEQHAGAMEMERVDELLKRAEAEHASVGEQLRSAMLLPRSGLRQRS